MVYKVQFFPRDVINLWTRPVLTCGVCRFCWLSVAFVYCIKTSILKLFKPFFRYEALWQCSNGDPWRGGRMKGAWKNCDFSTNISLYLRNNTRSSDVAKRPRDASCLSVVAAALQYLECRLIFTSDKGGGICLRPRAGVRFFVCLSVNKITQKRVHGFGWNVACRQMSGHGRTD